MSGVGGEWSWWLVELVVSEVGGGWSWWWVELVGGVGASDFCENIQSYQPINPLNLTIQQPKPCTQPANLSTN